MGTLARKKKKQSGIAGFSIVEALIASAIIGTLITTGYALIGSLFKFEKRVKDMTAEDRMIGSLVGNIRANLARHQYSLDNVGAKMEVRKYNDTTKSTDTFQELEESVMLNAPLPIAWSDTDFTSRANCPQCPGEMGYWIQPMEGAGMSGFLRIKLRVKHKRLYPDNGYRDYTFMATFK